MSPLWLLTPCMACTGTHGPTLALLASNGGLSLQAVESHIYSEALDTGDGSVRFAGFVVDQV